MKKKDPNYVVKLEKAIAKKYGEEAIQNPASSWSQKKEKKYLKQLKLFIEKQKKHEASEEPEKVDGFLITKKLLNKERKINCSVCYKLIRKINDEIYLVKYECCETCYVKYVEAREERWLKGWRPENVTKSS